MKYDLLHIQGKPYVLIPLHEYRMLTSDHNDSSDDLPAAILDEIHAGQNAPIKIIRNFRGMTQSELAEQSALSRPYLTEIETGRKQGSVRAIRAIADTLGVPTGLLVA